MAFYIQQTNLECEGKTLVFGRCVWHCVLPKKGIATFEWVDNELRATYVRHLTFMTLPQVGVAHIIHQEETRCAVFLSTLFNKKS